MLRRLNLEGDGQADLWGHGGAFRAVYADTAPKVRAFVDILAGRFSRNYAWREAH